VRYVLTILFILVASTVRQTAIVRAEACVADSNGSLVCGAGKAAFRVFADTTSPSKAYAFAWRSAEGVPSGKDVPGDDVENLLVRITDGAVIAKLGGAYWATGEMRANRYDQTAAWSPDSKAVVEVASSRWETDSIAYYRIDDTGVVKLDLRQLLEPALRAKLPARMRDGKAFRVREELPVTLDERGRIRFTAMLYVPKGDTSFDYAVRLDISAKGGKPTARIVSMQRVKSD
jgi:hypothetical protein